MKVRIRNFQSIKRVNFPLKGFTVVVGKNNIGKSAIVRAIDTALSNRPGTDFIRNGEENTRVVLEAPEMEIHYFKKDSAVYKVNGKQFTKLNRAVPQPILDAGYRKLEIGDQKLTPLMASQFEPLFLLDKPASVTEVLSSMYRLDILSRADDLCQKELRAAKRLSKTRTTDLESVKSQLTVFEGFEDLGKEIQNLTELETSCTHLRQEILDIQSLSQKKEFFEKTIKRLEKILSVKIPSSKVLEKKYENLKEIQGYSSKVKLLSNSVNRLKEVTQVSIPDHKGLEKGFTVFKEVSDLSERLKNIARSFRKQKELFKAVDVELDFDHSEKTFRELEDLRKKRQGFEKKAHTVKELRDQLKGIESQVEKEQQSLAEFKNCPTCGNPL